MRLILGVNLTDTWYRFALRLLGVHVTHAVPGLFALFLVVEKPLLHSKVHIHPAHSTLASSNSATLFPWALEKANHEPQILVQVLICLAV